MKQWFLSLMMICVLGITSESSLRLPASEDECQNVETISLYENIKRLISGSNDATLSLSDSADTTFNMRSFMPSYSYTESMYDSPFFTKMSESTLTSYHSKVLALQSDRNNRIANAWAPRFDNHGGLTNGFYGFNGDTAQAIRFMHTKPTENNPFIVNSAYYADTSTFEYGP